MDSRAVRAQTVATMGRKTVPEIFRICCYFAITSPNS
jgi:hypothetical protein